jgi:hypothetical protein
MKKFIFALSILFGSFSVEGQLNKPDRTTTRTEERSDNNSSGESYKDKTFLQHLSVGGNIGLNGSNGYLYFQIEPLVGYRFNKFLMAGISTSYSILSGNGESFHTFGGGPFLKIRPLGFLADNPQTSLISSLVLHAQGEFISYTGPSNFKGSYSTLLAGGGWHYNWDSGTSFYVLLLVDPFYKNIPGATLYSNILHYKAGVVYNFN